MNILTAQNTLRCAQWRYGSKCDALNVSQGVFFWRLVFSVWHDEIAGSMTQGVHYNDVMMGVMASRITSLTIVYPAVYSGPDQRKYQSSASLAFVRGNHRSPVISSHKWPVTLKMFPFDEVIMGYESFVGYLDMIQWLYKWMRDTNLQVMI